MDAYLNCNFRILHFRDVVCPCLTFALRFYSIAKCIYILVHRCTISKHILSLRIPSSFPCSICCCCCVCVWMYVFFFSFGVFLEVRGLFFFGVHRLACRRIKNLSFSSLLTSYLCFAESWWLRRCTYVLPWTISIDW